MGLRVRVGGAEATRVRLNDVSVCREGRFVDVTESLLTLLQFSHFHFSVQQEYPGDCVFISVAQTEVM